MGRRSRRSCKVAEAAAAPAPAPAAPVPAATVGKVMLKPSEEEVLAAVLSLYADKLKPYGRILRKRCGERALAASAATTRSSHALAEDAHERGHGNLTASAEQAKEEVPDVDPKHLKAVCLGSERIWVEEEEGAEWAALMPSDDCEDAFVDIYSSADHYGEEFWLQARVYLESLPAEVKLPGGRYACAQELLRLEPGFLAGWSLGEACHFVQLALTQHRLLGYLNGSLVPYERSQSRTKELCAAEHQACSSAPELPAADWETARTCLRTLLQESAGLVSVSNVKRLFRSRFELELSETLLGHSKLTNLLMDERMQGICAVQLHGHGHAVVEAPTEPVAGKACPALSIETQTEEQGEAQSCRSSRSSRSSLSSAPWLSGLSHSSASPPSLVKHTFIHVDSEGSLQGSSRRAHSLPPRLAEPVAVSDEPELELEPLVVDLDESCDSLESPDFCGVAFSWQDSGLWQSCEERCDSAASTASVPAVLELTDSDEESWADMEDKDHGALRLRSDGRLQALRQAGQQVVSQLWGSQPRWPETAAFSPERSPCEQDGQWELQGMVAVHVWRPHKPILSLAEHCAPEEPAACSALPPPPPPAAPSADMWWGQSAPGTF